MIPQEMKKIDSWVCWKTENRNNKPTKIPINPQTGANAASNDPKTWACYEDALKSYKENKYSGIGFMFTKESGIVGIDLDKYRDSSSGELNSKAKEILTVLNSYSEVSPGGTGIHILCKGKLPPSGRRNGSFEMYDSGRFFTVTGHVLTDYSPNLEKRTNEIGTLYRKYIIKSDFMQEKNLIINQNTENILQKAFNSKDGTRFKSLFEGRWKDTYPSQSEADQAFCNKLAFWFQCDPFIMDSVFRQSVLYRKKWDERHGHDTYGNITINEAIRSCKNTYLQPKEYMSKQRNEEMKDLQLISLANIESEDVHWLWYPYIPRGKITLLQGDPGQGKTFFSLNIAALISKGEPMPGETGKREPGTVLFQSAKDSLSDTIKPRLIQAGADCSRIYCIDEADSSLSFQDDRIEKMMETLKPDLVIFDPIQAFLGAGTDMHRANEVRPILARLMRLAEKYNAAIMLLMHLSKASTTNKLYRGLGSMDIPAAARSVLLCGSDPNNENNRGIVHTKSSLAPAGDHIAFCFDKDNGFKWMGKSNLTSDILLNPVKNMGIDSKLDKAKELLLDMLADGKEVLAASIYEKANDLGISDRTIKRAKMLLNVSANKGGFSNGRWYWKMEGCQAESAPIIRTKKQMSPFDENHGGEGLIEEDQWHPSVSAKEAKNNLALFEGTQVGEGIERRIPYKYFNNPQYDVEFEELIGGSSHECGDNTRG